MDSIRIQTVIIFFLKQKKETFGKKRKELYKKELAAETATKPQPNINQIKKFSAILEDISKY